MRLRIRCACAGLLAGALLAACSGGATPSRLLLPVLPGSDACAALGIACQ